MTDPAGCRLPRHRNHPGPRHSNRTDPLIRTLPARTGTANIARENRDGNRTSAVQSPRAGGTSPGHDAGPAAISVSPRKHPRGSKIPASIRTELADRRRVSKASTAQPKPCRIGVLNACWLLDGRGYVALCNDRPASLQLERCHVRQRRRSHHRDRLPHPWANSRRSSCCVDLLLTISLPSEALLVHLPGENKPIRRRSLR